MAFRGKHVKVIVSDDNLLWKNVAWRLMSTGLLFPVATLCSNYHVRITWFCPRSANYTTYQWRTLYYSCIINVFILWKIFYVDVLVCPRFFFYFRKNKSNRVRCSSPIWNKWMSCYIFLSQELVIKLLSDIRSDWYCWFIKMKRTRVCKFVSNHHME